MKFAFIAFLLLATIESAAAGLSAQMKLTEDPEAATLTVYDGGTAVLTYRFGDQLNTGIDPKYTRSCYIHPLYSLDGQILTEDFPKDHKHHSGLFWTWPLVKTRNQETQTWHMHLSELRQYFSRWRKRDITSNSAVLSVENVWKLKGQEIVAQEIVTIKVHPIENNSRAIDIELKLAAVGGSLELHGSPDQNKSYGGVSLRGAPIFTKGILTTDLGRLDKDSDNTPFKWADISTATEPESIGTAIFVSPDHPGAPVRWCIRNSYAGFLNPSWPGIKPVVIKPDRPVTLRYRIYIHRGDAAIGQVSQAYKLYVSQISK